MKNLKEITVSIIGLGQIGGSIAIDLTQTRTVRRVIGFDTDSTAVAAARHRGIIDASAHTLEEAAGSADLVILAAPIREIVRMAPVVCRAAGDGAAIMDVAGTKGEIRRVVTGQNHAVTYIGGHPMAGTEGAGLQAAAAGIFAGRSFVLTPIKETYGGWLALVRRLVESLGGNPVLLTAEEHDRIIAMTSHLPYVIAVAMMRLAEQRGTTDPALWKLIGGSFSDITRVAASAPNLTLDMFLTNQKQVVGVIDSLIMELNAVKNAVFRSHESFLKGMVHEARDIKENFFER